MRPDVAGEHLVGYEHRAKAHGVELDPSEPATLASGPLMKLERNEPAFFVE
jgi:hypothetical protein